jgi:hypothetical protein
VIAIKSAIDRIDTLEAKKNSINVLLKSVKACSDKLFVQTSYCHSESFPLTHVQILIHFIEKNVEDIDDELMPLREKLNILERLL